MKKYILCLMMVLTTALQANAISLGTAREEALYLTDKMAYELDLTPMQYEAVYEINLDYLTSINYYEPLGWAWENRNQDLRFVLSPLQYDRYIALEYFYRPVYWANGEWVYRIYTRYSDCTHFYFSRPNFYLTYTGGHSWRSNGNRSWYQGRTYVYNNDGMRYHLDHHGNNNAWRPNPPRGGRNGGNNYRGQNGNHRSGSDSRATQNHGSNNVGNRDGGNWRQRGSSSQRTDTRQKTDTHQKTDTRQNTRSSSTTTGTNSGKRGSFGGRR